MLKQKTDPLSEWNKQLKQMTGEDAELARTELIFLPLTQTYKEWLIENPSGYICTEY